MKKQRRYVITSESEDESEELDDDKGKDLDHASERESAGFNYNPFKNEGCPFRKL